MFISPPFLVAEVCVVVSVLVLVVASLSSVLCFSLDLLHRVNFGLVCCLYFGITPPVLVIDSPHTSALIRPFPLNPCVNEIECVFLKRLLLKIKIFVKTWNHVSCE